MNRLCFNRVLPVTMFLGPNLGGGAQTLRRSGSRFMSLERHLDPAKAKKPPPNSGRVKLLGVALLGSVTTGGLYYWRKERQRQDLLQKIGSQIANESSSQDYVLAESPPYFEPARKIRNTNDSTGIKLTLYQYQTCPFCCKARVFLDYVGLNYDVVEVNSVMRTQVKWSEYKKVPIVVAELKNGTRIQLNDSTLIISVIKSFINNPEGGLESILSCYPKVTSYNESGNEVTEVMNKYFLMFSEESSEKLKKEISEERKWRIWVDEVLVHTLSPNVYRTPSESLQAFKWFDEAGDWKNHFATWERYLVIYVGAAAMWLIGKKLKKRHHLKKDVRESLYDEINVWLKAIKTKKTTFMGGTEPNLSDLAVFGILNAIEGCQTFQDLSNETSITNWYEAMKVKCKNRDGQSRFAAEIRNSKS